MQQKRFLVYGLLLGLASAGVSCSPQDQPGLEPAGAARQAAVTAQPVTPQLVLTPNPKTGIIMASFQAPAGQPGALRAVDQRGRLVAQQLLTTTGSYQQAGLFIPVGTGPYVTVSLMAGTFSVSYTVAFPR